MAAVRKGMLPWKGAIIFLIACCFTGVSGNVPDDVVYTDLQKTVQLGDSAVLKCQFHGTPLAVYWKKGDDPRTAPNLVSWIPGDPVTGLCEGERPCQIMKMNGNFSLIIKDVSIAEQGRYICRVSSYKGILIYNFTDVKLFSPPQDPVPVINQCAVREPSSPQSCRISTSSPINITCLASRYYPNLDLFFLHGHNKITDLVTNEWTNPDGTKNKSISIKGLPSETSYVCVAWDIPGAKDQRIATILLRLPTVSPSVTIMTSAVTTAIDSRSSPVTIVMTVVPISLIALPGGILLYCCLKRRRRNAPASGEKDVEETQTMLQIKMPAEGAPAFGEKDVEETQTILEQTIKVHVEGMVSHYELWSLAYNTPKEDMDKVCAVLMELGMKISKKQMRSEQVYHSLCDWKKAAKPKEQAQKFRDALQSAKLGNIWQQIYEQRQQTTTSVSEGTLQQILLDLKSSSKIRKFLCKLISKGETNADTIKEKNVIDPKTELISDDAEEKSKLVSDTKSNVDGDDDKGIDISDGENCDEFSHAEKKNDVVQEAMRILREWKRGPFSENPYVLLSLALERAGFSHVSRAIFDGILSFYELRSLLYNMETPDMNKLHNLIKELGEVKDVKAGLGPQQIYEALCRWKEKHNKGDQSKIFRDVLERADLSEAWLKILETRHDTARVSDSTLKHILLEIKQPNKIQQFIGKLVPGSLRNQNASDDKDVIQQAMETLWEWNKGPFDENPMILLSRALERGGCNPVDRTFFYGTISYFELWSLVHAYKDDMKTLCHALRVLGIQDVHGTKTLDRVYVLLSEWKNQHHARDQLLALKVLLVEAGLFKLFENLHERRYRTDVNISDDTLEYIMWHVKDPNKINNLLLELSQNLGKPSLDVAKPARDFIKAALDESKQWKKGPGDVNPVVQLSLALERSKCTPVDRSFFRVPIYLQAPIGDVEVEMFVHKLTSRHCKRLANSLSTIDEKRVWEILDENNDVLFDTKSMISDWIAGVECSNYEKRCRLDDAVTDIGRHDMTDPFGTIAYRREIGDDLIQPHPASEYFDHDTIFDDDLISLTKLMSCLDERIMTTFCMSVGIFDHVGGDDKRCPLEQELSDWRESNLKSKSPNGSAKSVFSQITELMGNTTYGERINYVTDDELMFIKSQLKTNDKKEKVLSGLYIHRDEKKGKWTMQVGWLWQNQELPVSDRQDEETDSADDVSVSEGEQDEVETNVPNVKDRQVESVFVDLLKEWRNRCGDEFCREKLRSVLKTVGAEECIANRTPRKYMYKTELVHAAFNILLRDVLPVIQALSIDQMKAEKYRRQNPDLEKGSLSLLIQLCKGTAYYRRNFLPFLLKCGYIDATKSLYLDYEQSLGELSSIASRIQEDKFQSFIKEIGIIPDELTECSGTSEEAHYIEVMRIWKNKIRPVPYHYRMHIVTALQTIGCMDLAAEVLSGLYRGTAANDDVIRAICSRLDSEQTNRLCDLLKLKPDEELEIPTGMVVRWVNKWMDEYDPFPMVPKGKSLDLFVQRKHTNNELVKAGFYELANEIMMLEFSRF